jgi:hypothetical protein
MGRGGVYAERILEKLAAQMNGRCTSKSRQENADRKIGENRGT